MEYVGIRVQHTVLADVVDPPWHDHVQPHPEVPRELPDEPAPARTHRDAEDDEHEPRRLLLARLWLQSQRNKTMAFCWVPCSFSTCIASRAGAVRTCWLVPELWNVQGAMNFQWSRSMDARNPSMLASSIFSLIGPPPSRSCSTVKKRNATTQRHSMFFVRSKTGK